MVEQGHNQALRTEEEEEYEWHGLPDMIGSAINDPDYGVHMWGRYLVRRVDGGQGDGNIIIYRVVENAESKAGLSRGREFGTQIGERWYAGRSCGRLEAPEDGWESETEMLPESIFAGYE